MLEDHLVARGINDPLVLEAMANVPREQFIPPDLQLRAYDDCALPIGHHQTISQPYIVASILQLGRITADSMVLDIGTGCGYMAAVAARIAQRVCTLERITELAEIASARFSSLGIGNIDQRIGDGYEGWPEHELFDSILVSCATDNAPPKLIKQLKYDGRMIAPIDQGHQVQMLTSYHKLPSGQLDITAHMAVRFVPMV